MTIGPVPHPDDALKNKMNAPNTRACPHVFIDIDAAVHASTGALIRELTLDYQPQQRNSPNP